ncbi:hypothetical protein GGF50DRAFT_63256 [Schizophyllum commune]
MTTNRNVVCRKIAAVPYIPLDDFLKAYMPRSPLNEAQRGVVFAKLTERWRATKMFPEYCIEAKKKRADAWSTAHAPLEVDANGRTRWTDYAISPAHRRGHEKEIFGDLVDIHGQIVACCLETVNTLVQTTSMHSNGSRSLESQKLNTSMPDGVHLLVDHLGGLFDWDSTAIADEYKCLRNYVKLDDNAPTGKITDTTSRSAAKELLDNAQKVFWGMHHMMRTDTRRRCAFGMTFADTEVRLWHYNRSVIVVSRPFDFNLDAAILIDVYSRFAFASMSELGYDTSIQLLRYQPSLTPGEKPSDQYRIQACGASYITVATLANIAAENGIGRCTRVFRAYKEDESPRQFYVIKDSWLEAGRQTEHEIYVRIMSAIRQHDWDALYDDPIALDRIPTHEGKIIDPQRGKLSTEDRTKFFIPVLASERVKVDGVIDNTQDVLARRYAIPVHPKVYSIWDGAVLTVGQRSVLTGVAGIPEGSIPRQDKGCFLNEIPAREHHRTVMKEGKGLHAIKNIHLAFSTVRDVSYALFILHSVGFLYRDVSAGNILRYDDRGVLADLEYVKGVDEVTTHCKRTGTADFTAVEVVDGVFLVTPDEGEAAPLMDDNGDEDDAEDDDSANKKDVSRQGPTFITIDGRHVPWRFRDAHDLESIYWVMLWLLFRHAPEVDPPNYDRQKQLDRYEQMFPHSCFSTASARVNMLRHKDALLTTMQLLPALWRKKMTSMLANLRRYLYTAYVTRPGRPLHPAMWLLVDYTCRAGTQIKGEFTRLTKEDDSFIVYQRSRTITGADAGTQESVAISASKRAHQEETNDDVFSASGQGVEVNPVSARLKRTRLVDPELDVEAQARPSDPGA